MTTVPDVVRPAGQSDRWRVLAEKLAPNASRLDLDYFAEAAHHLGLTPFSNPPEIVLIDRWDKRLGRTVYRPQVTIDGRMAMARRTGKVIGIEGPHYTGPRQKWTDRDGQRIWIDAWDCEDEGGYPRAARYLIHILGDVVPVNGTAPWPEFCQHDKTGKLLDTWAQMPTVMLAKCALSLGLRRSGIEKLPADIPVDYEGDGSEVLDRDDTLISESAGQDARAASAGDLGERSRPVEDHHQLVAEPGDQWRTCSCGERFPTDAAFHAHKQPPVQLPGPAPAPPTAPGETQPPASRPAGPGTRSRKPVAARDDRPPDDLYDRLPEARGFKPAGGGP
jgi:hypothetical protein